MTWRMSQGGMTFASLGRPLVSYLACVDGLETRLTETYAWTNMLTLWLIAKRKWFTASPFHVEKHTSVRQGGALMIALWGTSILLPSPRLEPWPNSLQPLLLPLSLLDKATILGWLKERWTREIWEAYSIGIMGDTCVSTNSLSLLNKKIDYFKSFRHF